jgi:hypothetical protein
MSETYNEYILERLKLKNTELVEMLQVVYETIDWCRAWILFMLRNRILAVCRLGNAELESNLKG